MAVSLASCLMISIFVADELLYDRHNPDGDRVYRVYNQLMMGGVEGDYAITPYPFASYMQKEFPEIESTLRFLDAYGEEVFEAAGKKVMEGNGIISESSAFDMLAINVIHGDRKSALARPGTVTLSESLAKKLFGDIDPVGKSVKINAVDHEITSVFADLPSRSHLKISYMKSLESTDWPRDMQNNFQRHQISTYLKLVPGTDAAALEAKFPAFVEKHAVPALKNTGISYKPHLQNLRDIHLHSSSFQWEIAQRGDAQSVYILLAAAIIILTIACLNFVNLSTARAVKRMKEVGIRKATGAHRSQLITQFLAESVLFTMIGLVLAVVIAQTALPYLNAIVEKNLDISYSAVAVSAGILFCVMLGTLAGAYPAIYLSGFAPSVLSGKSERVGGSGVFRQSLVVMQFMLSFFLIAGSLIILSQNNLIQSKDLGFNKEHIIIVPLRKPQLRDVEATKLKYLDHPNVVSATISFGLPGDAVAGDAVRRPGVEEQLSCALFCVDFDYIPTMDMKMVAGRPFSREFATDSTEAFIVNETFLESFNLGTPEEAIGERLDWERWDNQKMKEGRIIGVVKDFHFKSLREKLSPIAMHILPGAGWKLAAKIKGDNVQETIAHIRSTYEKLDPEWTFTYNFLDESLDSMYRGEQRLGKLFLIFTWLAIAVACLGLFGLVEFSVNQRAKEISIRKVFGASVSSLLLLLTKRYFVLLCISCLLIVPLVWFMAEKWLNRFAYQIDLEPMLFLKAGGLIVLVTAIAVSFQSIRAASSNPVNNLRND